MTVLLDIFERDKKTFDFLKKQTALPILPGNCKVNMIPRGATHECHLQYLFSKIGILKYWEFRRAGLKYKAIYDCVNCLHAGLRTACYLKLYGHIRKDIKKALWILKNMWHPEGTDMLHDLPDWMIIHHELLSRKEYGEAAVISKDIDYITKFYGHERYWSIPSVNAMIPWESQKKSKIHLMHLPPPSERALLAFRRSALLTMVRKLPDSIPIVPGECTYKLGSNTYYDGTKILKDSEKPEGSYSCPLLYKCIESRPCESREILIPSKSYKSVSTYWMIIISFILKSYEEVVTAETPEVIYDSVVSRMIPHRTIDLKGAGLQFPKEYVIDVLRIVKDYYDSPDMENMFRIAEEEIMNLSYYKDGSCHKTTRGTGLGYFEYAKALVVRLILEGLRILKMFNDDILIHEDDYQLAVDRLEAFGLLINEKKSGFLFRNYFSFAGMIGTGDGTALNREWENNAKLASVFTPRYHWERKFQTFMLPKEFSYYVAYHYERTFGYEFYKGESINHPTALGINQMAEPVGGFHPYGELFGLPTPRVETPEDFFLPVKDKVSLKEARDFHMLRKNMWKNRKYEYSYLREFFNPKIEEVRDDPSLFISKYARLLPDWAEKRLIVEDRISTGRLQSGIPNSSLYEAVNQNKYARNPFLAAATGGYLITSPLYIEHPIIEETQSLINILMECEDISTLNVYRKGLHYQEYFDSENESDNDGAPPLPESPESELSEDIDVMMPMSSDEE